MGREPPPPPAAAASLTREDGLVELVHDAVAVRLLVPQGLHSAHEAGGAEVHLLSVRVLLGGLALLAPDEAQLFSCFESRSVTSRHVVRWD